MTPTLYKHFTLSAGVGLSIGKINAFDRALISAGISDYNIVKISSILPPNCVEAHAVLLGKGMILPTAYTCIYSDIPGSKIAASIAVAIPKDSSDIGVIIKHASNMTKADSESLARSYAIQAMEDRNLPIKEILSTSTDCVVSESQFCCAIAAVSLW